MKHIMYYDFEEGNEIDCTEEQFLKDAKNIDFEVVLEQTRYNQDIRNELMKILLMRTYSSPYIQGLKNSGYYKEFIDYIITGNDVLAKIHLVLYLEPNLLEVTFGNINNLIDAINNQCLDFNSTITLSRYLTVIPKFGCSESILKKIIDSIDILMDIHYQKGVEIINKDDEIFRENNEKAKKKFMKIARKNKRIK